MTFLPTIAKKYVQAGMLVQCICAVQAYGYDDIWIPPLTWLCAAVANKGRNERGLCADFYADGYEGLQRTFIYYADVVGLQKRGPNQPPIIYDWYEWQNDAIAHGLIDVKALWRVREIDKAFKENPNEVGMARHDVD